MGTKRKSHDDKITRMLRLISMLMSARAPLPYSSFKDESRWGSTRNMMRFLADVNANWEAVMKSPLFYKVQINGRTHITMADDAFAKIPERRVAVMSAAVQFLKALKGSLIEDELQPIQEAFTTRLTAAERKKLDRLKGKFFYVGKGQKDYSKEPLKGILDEVYTSLIKEKELQITTTRDGKQETKILQPLSLVLFNSSLYLVAASKDERPGSRPKTYRLESLTGARHIPKSTLPPRTFNAEEFYQDYFGLSTGSGSEPMSTIMLEFADNKSLQKYIQERRWSGHDKFTQMTDGKLRLTMKLKITPELTPWILGMGANVKVTAPAALVAEVAAACRAMGKIY